MLHWIPVKKPTQIFFHTNKRFMYIVTVFQANYFGANIEINIRTSK